MASDARQRRVDPAWWTAGLVVIVCASVFATSALFSGWFRSYLPVTLTSDRAGLVMESGGKVKMRGVEVGRVATISPNRDEVNLKLEIYPDQVRYIPANVQAQIRATTAFGAKYVDLLYPADPSPQRISAGAVLKSNNVSTEVNTVFQNLVSVLKQIDPAKVNAVLSAVAEGVRGEGDAIGQATTDANQVLLAVNPRMDTVRADFQSFARFNAAYANAAKDILTILSQGATTSATITSNAKSLDALLLNAVGLGRSATDLLGPNEDNFIQGINGLEPTTNLLLKYNPEYTCLLVGAKWFLDNGGYEQFGGNGRTVVIDSGLMFGDDPYKYPKNLPIVAAKGGPGGKPSCGSLPDASKNFPVRSLVMNTGWGTDPENDWRTHPRIGNPWWVNFFPATRAAPEPPFYRYDRCDGSNPGC